MYLILSDVDGCHQGHLLCPGGETRCTRLTNIKLPFGAALGTEYFLQVKCNSLECECKVLCGLLFFITFNYKQNLQKLNHAARGD